MNLKLLLYRNRCYYRWDDSESTGGTSIIKMGVQKISIVNGTKDFTEVTGECIGTTVTKGVSIA